MIYEEPAPSDGNSNVAFEQSANNHQHSSNSAGNNPGGNKIVSPTDSNEIPLSEELLKLSEHHEPSDSIVTTGTFLKTN